MGKTINLNTYYYNKTEIDALLENKASVQSVQDLNTNITNEITDIWDTLGPLPSTKEDKFNKIGSWSSTPDSNKYPNESLVKSELNNLGNSLSSGLTNIWNTLGPLPSTKEDKTNKIDSWSSNPSSEKYPSEYLVKPELDNKANKTDLNGDSILFPYPIESFKIGSGDTVRTAIVKIAGDVYRQGIIDELLSLKADKANGASQITDTNASNYTNIGSLTNRATQQVINQAINTKFENINTETEIDTKLKDSNIITEYIVGTQTASTSAWTGKSSKISSLQTGQVIYYKLLYASTSTAVTLNLTLADGSTTGAKEVWFWNGARMNTQYGVNSVIGLVYNGSQWWAINPSNNNNNSYLTSADYYTSGEALTLQNLIACKKADNKYYKINTLKNTVINLSNPVLMANGTVNANTNTNSSIIYHPWVVANNFNGGTTLTLSSTVYQPVYLEGTSYSNGNFTVSSTPITQTLIYGRYYILLGVAYNSTGIGVDLTEQTVLYYNGTNLIESVSWNGVVDKPSSFTPSHHNQASTTITEASALSNLGTSANATQSIINSKINEKIGTLSSIKAIEVVATKPTASAGTMNKLYIVSENNKVNVYYTSQSESTYSWHKMDTDILDELSIAWNDITGKPAIDTTVANNANNLVTSQAVYNGLNGKAPTSHASTGTGYGVGTTTNYGHVKVVQNLTTNDGNGLALGAGQGKVLKELIEQGINDVEHITLSISSTLMNNWSSYGIIKAMQRDGYSNINEFVNNIVENSGISADDNKIISFESPYNSDNFIFLHCSNNVQQSCILCNPEIQYKEATITYDNDTTETVYLMTL